MKIISLVPSITELLFTLGLEEQVTGITKFCVHPEQWFYTKTRVGGTKTLNLDTITSLAPDLIIANKEENVKEQVELLSKKFQVLLTDINNYSEAIQMILQVGALTGKSNEAERLVVTIQEQFAILENRCLQMKTAAYLIWKDPWMTVGGDTFIHDMMQKAGFKNVFGHKNRYPQTSQEAIRQLQPQYLLLSSEPYPFKQKHVDELQGHFPGSKILLVDGEMFSWYGSRMLHAPKYFKFLHNNILASFF